MFVRCLVALAGRDFSHAPGDLYECDDASAARLVANGIAEHVVLEAPARETPVESAVVSAPERAVVRGKKR